MTTETLITARAALGPKGLRLLYEAHVLRDRRFDPDRRLKVAYPRGGRRTEDFAHMDEYRHSIAVSNPFRWRRRVVEGVEALLVPALLVAIVVVAAWIFRLLWPIQ